MYTFGGPKYIFTRSPFMNYQDAYQHDTWCTPRVPDGISDIVKFTTSSIIHAICLFASVNITIKFGISCNIYILLVLYILYYCCTIEFIMLQ